MILVLKKSCWLSNKSDPRRIARDRMDFFSRLSGTLFQNGAILHWGRRQRSIAPETGEYDLDQSALTKNEKR
jgi:hypothetical protein